MIFYRSTSPYLFYKIKLEEGDIAYEKNMRNTRGFKLNYAFIKRLWRRWK